MSNRFVKELINTLITLAAAAMSAFGLHIFVYPAGFAPSGIDGIATMLQEVTGLNAGYFTLLFNLPLLIVAWFFLKLRYVIYTVLFTVLSSLMLVVLEAVDFYSYVTATDRLIPAIFSGIILGVRTGIMLKIGASTGGVDIAAGMIQKKLPHVNIERIITIICYAIILVSYFIYRDVTAILLSIVQMFVFDIFAGRMLKDHRNAVEVKIVTKCPEAIKNDIICNLKHGATVLNSRGMFTDGESSVIISVINIRQIPEFLEIMKKYPDTFTYYGELMGVKGNFRWRKDDAVK
ncbi:MAG: YitT family protein [Clostridia bacterium]|nr:YitT family protein [Clostridia bacterium]